MDAVGWACLGLFVLAVLAVAAVIGVLYAGKLREKAYYNRHGEPAVGWIVQAHNELYRSFSADGSIAEFAQVLVVDGPRANRVDPAVGELARRVARLKGTTPSDPDGRRVAKWVTDERARPEVRRRLPDSITGGREAYLVHVLVYRSMLPRKTLSHPFVRLLMIWDEPERWPHMAPYEPDDDEYRYDD